MENALKADTAVDLNLVAQNLSLTEIQVRAAAELLEQGNTIPFITRYRSDATNGLNERQLLDIRSELSRLTALAERKAIILKSIENQDTLTDDLRQRIESANQSRILEDLYLPFKPRKQSLAVAARQQGLEPLARDILEARTTEVDLPTRAAEFVRVDKGLANVDEVFRGVRHILAERFSEHQKLRRSLRKLFWDHSLIEVRLSETIAAIEKNPEKKTTEPAVVVVQETVPSSAETIATSHELVTQVVAEAVNESPALTCESSPAEPDATVSASLIEDPATQRAERAASEPLLTQTVAVDGSPLPSAVTNASVARSLSPKPVVTRKKKKKKKKKLRPEPFAEFANFSQTIQKLPPHRILGINRGERAGHLKVRITVDEAKISEIAREMLVPNDHPFAEFLREAGDDALTRLIVPAVEREIRRELTERAEVHAVRVFAKNLRNLVLQQPVRGHRIMGIDPGYRSGCKVAVVDAMGRPIGHGVFSIVGNDDRKKNNQQRLLEILNQFQPSLIAIGNGSGCHAVEQFVSEVIGGIDDGRKFQFTIVNQAGTSTYSTCETAREELPNHDPLVRSAISIARRLQDPLSELVKVHPANIGVGMYQHDVRAKHLSEILDEEVESCVNFVGVDVNTASVSLLRHISGLGPLTARRIVEYRDANGPFANRESLRQVPGMGEVTWKQSIGFLRIADSPNLLDRTNIHPESYETVMAILNHVGGKLDDLFLPLPVSVEKTAGPIPTASPATTPASPVVSSDSPEAQEDPNVPLVENAVSTTAEISQPNSPVTEHVPLVVEPAVPVEPALSAAEIAALRERRLELTRKLRATDPVDLSQKIGIGEMTVRDILRALRNPYFDPRENLPAPVFRTGVLKFEDLQPGMRLRGQIVNVVDFGVFINIGIGDSCLIHISRLSNRFIRDPHWHFAVADVLDVWVQEVDIAKKRVTLTAVQPESAKKERPRTRRGSGGKPKPELAAASSSSSSVRPASRSNDSGKGRAGGNRSFQNSPRTAKTYEQKPHKPKPVTPISEEMVKGKKPMRSFSDLMQFHQKKSTDDTGSDQ